MDRWFPVIRRLLLFAGVAGLFSLAGPQLGVLVAHGTSYGDVVKANWDAVAAVSGLLALGVLEAGWGAWLCFSVSGGFRDNNVAGGALSLLAGVTLVVAAGVVLYFTVLT
ncbi:hypothetical protein [Streptomyces sp. NPDC058773]|uniref:hypothetical protein n=1 Tax=Streptomyces sp. NPDC058773 TaxID=3346632 RepID=UPI0036AB3CDD